MNLDCIEAHRPTKSLCTSKVKMASGKEAFLTWSWTARVMLVKACAFALLARAITRFKPRSNKAYCLFRRGWYNWYHLKDLVLSDHKKPHPSTFHHFHRIQPASCCGFFRFGKNLRNHCSASAVERSSGPAGELLWGIPSLKGLFGSFTRAQKEFWPIAKSLRNKISCWLYSCCENGSEYIMIDAERAFWFHPLIAGWRGLLSRVRRVTSQSCLEVSDLEVMGEAWA